MIYKLSKKSCLDNETGSSSVPANNTVSDSTASSSSSTAQPAQDLADVPRPPPVRHKRSSDT